MPLPLSSDVTVLPPWGVSPPDTPTRGMILEIQYINDIGEFVTDPNDPTVVGFQYLVQLNDLDSDGNPIVGGFQPDQLQLTDADPPLESNP